MILMGTYLSEEEIMNTGYHAARITSLNAELQRLIAASQDHERIYFIATEMMLELSHIRSMAGQGKIQE